MTRLKSIGRTRRWIAAVALAVALPAALPAAAVDTPQRAIGKETAAVVYIDIEQIKPEMIGGLGMIMAGLGEHPLLADQGAALPLGDVQKIVEKATTFRNDFVKAGGQGLMLTLGMPKEESWSPPMSLLTKAKGELDTKIMAKMMNDLGEGKTNAELVAIDNGWYDISVVSLEGDAISQALPQPDAVAFKAFDKQLKVGKTPIIKVAFRMQERLRLMLDQQAGAAQGGAQQDPNAAMMVGMMSLIKDVDTLGFAISKGPEDSTTVDIQMVFLNADAATQFMGMYNAMMMFAPAMIAQEIQRVEGAPNPAEINQFFAMLKMNANGETLSLTLDKPFFDMVQKLGPLMQNIQGPPNAAGDVPF